MEYGDLVPLEVAVDARLRTCCGNADSEIAEEAGALGRRWLPSHHTIDSADLAIAATVVRTDARLLTRNARRFPMFTDLRPPY